MKKFMALSLLAAAGTVPVIPVLADQAASQPTTQPMAMDVGNTKCAVMAEDEIDPKVTYTFEGKLYHFCCADCIKDFKKNPDKYAKAIAADPAKYGVKKS